MPITRQVNIRFGSTPTVKELPRFDQSGLGELSKSC
jgi:hypothetical protein